MFIIDSDYSIRLYNDDSSTITIELTTVSDHNFYKQGYDLCYLKKIDVYEYYYGATFHIQLPNRLNVCCVASDLDQKKTCLLLRALGFMILETAERQIKDPISTNS